ncbi:MAG: class I SAM-dependent rRNA methyltransferase, partial [Myxococcota bacterium]
VQDAGGRRAGSGLFSPASNIRLRMLKRGPKPFDRDELARRIVAANERRAVLGRDAYRVVHGEADFLPGLFVDRYDDAYAVQATCAGMDAILGAVTDVLVERFEPRAVVLRNNAASRAREGLPREIQGAVGSAPILAKLREGQLHYEVDLLGEQKTGAFLDQVDNHVRVRDFARGRGFDGFTYHGGFALQLAAGGCSEVIAADQSISALDVVRRRAQSGGLDAVQTLESDVTELLPEWADAGERFDTVVIDPPAFASTRATVKRALRAYEQLNSSAMRCMNTGGVLVSCSCSGQVTGADFDEMLAQAARSAGRRVLMLERRGAGLDHPVLAGVPETEYLKCRILQVV